MSYAGEQQGATGDAQFAAIVGSAACGLRLVADTNNINILTLRCLGIAYTKHRANFGNEFSVAAGFAYMRTHQAHAGQGVHEHGKDT